MKVKIKILEKSDLKNSTFRYFYSITLKGNNHKLANKPCQDSGDVFIGTVEKNNILISSIADGHGNDQCDLSDIGSKLAVKVAIKEVKKIYQKFSGNKKLLLNNLVSYLPLKIREEWKIKLKRKHFKLFDENISEDGMKRYGTTLLFALSAPEGLFFGQLGDGKILIVSKNGEIYDPIKTSTQLIGNETFSINSRDSIRLWSIKTHTIDCDSLFVMTSDGLVNSFENDEQFFIFLRSLYRNLKKYKIIKMKTLLKEWLKNASIKGSGDDIVFSFFELKPEKNSI